jgi:hypothetical protein
MKRIFLAVICIFFAVSAYAQSTTTNLEITKPQTGQAQPQVTIATGFDQFDAAVAGRLSKAVTTADVTLTTTEARNQILEFTGTLTGNRNVIVPSKNRTYAVYNNTAGAFTLTVKTSGGTGIAVTQGTRSWLYCDATNVVQITAAGSGGASTALDNLASVAINTALLPGTTDAVDLGSTSKFFRNGFLSSYSDWKRISAPSNPASGALRLFADNGTGKLACLDSSGGDCMPSGGGGGSGDVVGPGSATDNALARFDGTTGKLIQNSTITLSDGGALSFPDGVTQVFNPDSTNSGFNFGSLSGGVAPSSADDGDAWYGSTENRVNFQINGQVQGVGGDSSSISLFTGGNQVFRGSSTAFGHGTLHATWSADGFNPVLASVGLVADINGVLRLSNASTGGATFTTVGRSPAQITSDQNDYNPGTPSYFQRWNSDASRNVTGLTFTNGQPDGQFHVIWNVGSFNIVLTNEDAGSTAANRFLTTTGSNITIAPNGCARVMRDATSSRWRVEACN